MQDADVKQGEVMQRATKDPALKARSREIYATDDEWAKVKSAATAADMKISSYLLSRPRTSSVRSAQGVARLLAVSRASVALQEIAASIPEDFPGAALLLSRLASVEAELAIIRTGRSA